MGRHAVIEASTLLVVVIWAANFIIVKAANTQIPPIAFATLRFGSAALLLLAILRWREGSIRMPWAEVAPILGIGALGFGLYQYLWPTALQWIPAGDSAFLIAATPVITALLVRRAGSESMTRTKLAGAAVSFVGVWIVIAGGPGLELGNSFAGDLVTLLAALCWATYTAFGAPILARCSPLRTTAWAMTGGSLVLLPIGLVQGASTDWAAVQPAAWAGLAFSALLPAGLANVVVFNAIRVFGPTRVANLQFLVPFLAVLMGAAFLDEPVQAAQLAGGAVIIAGVAMARSTTLTGFAGRVRAWLVP